MDDLELTVLMQEPLDVHATLPLFLGELPPEPSLEVLAQTRLIIKALRVALEGLVGLTSPRILLRDLPDEVDLELHLALVARDQTAVDLITEDRLPEALRGLWELAAVILHHEWHVSSSNISPSRQHASCNTITGVPSIGFTTMARNGIS